MIITTFGPKGYIDYGKRFLETYREYCTEPLVVYVEEPIEEDVEQRDLFKVPGCQDFVNTVKDWPVRSYRRDVNKFSRKVFAITDAALSHNGNMAFFGGDVFFNQKMPETFLEDVLEDRYIAYLGRSGYHSETDFIAFDTTQVMNNLFHTLFRNIYTTGAFTHMKYWCDSDVFDFVRTMLNAPCNNLNVIDDDNHPYINSTLGTFSDHPKGPLRKLHGKSFEEDYVA